jgi:ABC-2 type transport system permease protein
MRPHAIAALIRRDALEGRRYPASLLLDLLFGVINLVIFLYISRTFRGVTTGHLHGAGSYFAFASVGIAFMIVIQAATTSVVRRVRAERQAGTLEALASAPVTSGELAVGMAGFGYAFGALRAAIYLGISALWLGLDVPDADWLGVAIVLVLGTVALMAIGIGLSALVLVYGRAEALTRVAVVALAFLSGAYFPVSVLPKWLEDVSVVLPSRIALDGLRAAFFDVGDWPARAGWLVVCIAVGFPLALLAFRAGLRATIRRGTITGA